LAGLYRCGDIIRLRIFVELFVDHHLVEAEQLGLAAAGDDLAGGGGDWPLQISSCGRSSGCLGSWSGGGAAARRRRGGGAGGGGGAGAAAVGAAGAAVGAAGAWPAQAASREAPTPMPASRRNSRRLTRLVSSLDICPP